MNDSKFGKKHDCFNALREDFVFREIMTGDDLSRRSRSYLNHDLVCRRRVYNFFTIQDCLYLKTTCLSDLRLAKT